MCCFFQFALFSKKTKKNNPQARNNETGRTFQGFLQNDVWLK